MSGHRYTGISHSDLRKPPGPMSIRRNYPRADDIIAAFAFNDGAGNFLKDAKSGRFADNDGRAWANTPYGLGSSTGTDGAGVPWNLGAGYKALTYILIYYNANSSVWTSPGYAIDARSGSGTFWYIEGPTSRARFFTTYHTSNVYTGKGLILAAVSFTSSGCLLVGKNLSTGALSSGTGSGTTPNLGTDVTLLRYYNGNQNHFLASVLFLVILRAEMTANEICALGENLHVVFDTHNNRPFLFEPSTNPVEPSTVATPYYRLLLAGDL